MKKIINLICISLLSICFITPAYANETSKQVSAIDDFMEMQNDITDSMNIINEHYVYDYEVIENIVYNFNVF